MIELDGKQVRDTLEEILHPPSCAVVAIDLQNDFVHPDGKLAHAGVDISAMVDLLPRCAAFIARARELGIRVVHAHHVTLPNGASDSAPTLRLKRRVGSVTDFCLDGTWGAEICESCAPAPGELVVRKHRSSAFVGTSLNQLLRANGIDTVVVIGEQTPGCIEATFRDAVHLDYYTVLVEDCVAAFDPELHEASLKITRARHDVATAEAVLAIWAGQLGR